MPLSLIFNATGLALDIIGFSVLFGLAIPAVMRRNFVSSDRVGLDSVEVDSGQVERFTAPPERKAPGAAAAPATNMLVLRRRFGGPGRVHAATRCVTRSVEILGAVVVSAPSRRRAGHLIVGAGQFHPEVARGRIGHHTLAGVGGQIDAPNRAWCMLSGRVGWVSVPGPFSGLPVESERTVTV